MPPACRRAIGTCTPPGRSAERSDHPCSGPGRRYVTGRRAACDRAGRPVATNPAGRLRHVRWAAWRPSPAPCRRSACRRARRHHRAVGVPARGVALRPPPWSVGLGSAAEIGPAPFHRIRAGDPHPPAAVGPVVDRGCRPPLAGRGRDSHRPAGPSSRRHRHPARGARRRLVADLPEPVGVPFEAAPRRGRALARQVLDDLAAGCRSAPECELRDVVRASRVLPPPRLNKPLPGVRGMLPDACWPEARLVIEVDSRSWHGFGDAPERTERRRARYAALGWTVLPVSPARLRAEPGAVLRQIEAAYLAGIARHR